MSVVISLCIGFALLACVSMVLTSFDEYAAEKKRVAQQQSLQKLQERIDKQDQFENDWRKVLELEEECAELEDRINEEADKEYEQLLKITDDKERDEAESRRKERRKVEWERLDALKTKSREAGKAFDEKYPDIPKLAINVESTSDQQRVRDDLNQRMKLKLPEIEQVDGIMIRKVFPGPIEQSGVRAGDIVLKLDGKKVNTRQDLNIELRSKHYGQIVRLDILRGRTPMMVSVQITRRYDFL